MKIGGQHQQGQNRHTNQFVHTSPPLAPERRRAAAGWRRFACFDLEGDTPWSDPLMSPRRTPSIHEAMSAGRQVNIMRPSALLSLAVALVLLAVARHDHGGLVPPSVEPLKPGSNRGKALIVLYGVLARGLGYTWPYIRNAIIAPLEQDAGLAVTVVGIDIDVGSHHVDGQILDRSFFESSVVASQSDRMCANSSLRARPGGALPLSLIHI